MKEPNKQELTKGFPNEKSYKLMNDVDFGHYFLDTYKLIHDKIECDFDQKFYIDYGDSEERLIVNEIYSGELFEDVITAAFVVKAGESTPEGENKKYIRLKEIPG